MELKKENINKSARNEEVLMAIFLQKYFFREDELRVGDDSHNNIPDIYNESKTVGIDVVRMELENDFKAEKIYGNFEKHSGNYKAMLTDKKAGKIIKENEGLFVNADGVVTAWTHKEEGGLPLDYLKEIYNKNLKNKIENLNNGNYSGIKGEVSLAIISDKRYKGDYDIEILLRQYGKIMSNEKSFDNLFVLFTSGIYKIDRKMVINKISFDGQEYSEGVKYYKRISLSSNK